MKAGQKQTGKTDTVLWVLVLILVVLGLGALFRQVNIMAEYVSTTLPIILKSSSLPRHWGCLLCIWHHG